MGDGFAGKGDAILNAMGFGLLDHITDGTGSFGTQAAQSKRDFIGFCRCVLDFFHNECPLLHLQ
ncbi:MAG: hypothetical protein ACLUO4_01625 [Christensenellales bacterium]